MKLTRRQYVLLITALTVLYDDVCKTSTTRMKNEIMELSEIIQYYAEDAE